MAISKKGKRKIVVNNQNYLWWGFWEYDQTAFDGNQVKIVADNQSFLFHYGLEQEEERRNILLIIRDQRRVWLKAPRFETKKGQISSKGISEIIKWIKNEISKPKVEIEAFYPEKVKDEIGLFISDLNKAINKV